MVVADVWWRMWRVRKLSPMNVCDLPVLGVGIAFRQPFLADVFHHLDAIDFLEITADHYFNGGPGKYSELDLLKRHFTLIPHGLDLSLGSAEGIDDAYLAATARAHCACGPAMVERAHRVHSRGRRVHRTSRPTPLDSRSRRCRRGNVERVKSRIHSPLILENITSPMIVPGSEMDEVEFLTAVLDRTGCGLLCDVTNLYTNSVNHAPRSSRPA